MMMDVFEHATVEPDSDTGRTCGSCGNRKDWDHFYKDGKTSDGTLKYRRDCKECYRVTRLKARKKKKEVTTPAPKRRGRK